MQEEEALGQQVVRLAGQAAEEQVPAGQGAEEQVEASRFRGFEEQVSPPRGKVKEQGEARRGLAT